jgi:hypothetical protein
MTYSEYYPNINLKGLGEKPTKQVGLFVKLWTGVREILISNLGC